MQDISFKTWLAGTLKTAPDNNKRVEGFVKALAQEARDNSLFPRGNNYKHYYRYLVNKKAPIECVRAFRSAWLQWIDEGLDIEQMSWQIPAPRYPEGGSWVWHTLEDAYAKRGSADGEPVYSELAREHALRKGYLEGFYAAYEFLHHGGLPRQLASWLRRIIRWRSCIDPEHPFVSPPGAPAGWNRMRLVILDRDERICQYCGLPNARHVDHIFPVKLGGTDAENNLVAACKRCNLEKGAKHPLDWTSSRCFLSEHKGVVSYLAETFENY